MLVQVKLKIDLNWLIPKFDWLIANKSEGFTNMEKMAQYSVSVLNTAAYISSHSVLFIHLFLKPHLNSFPRLSQYWKLYLQANTTGET